MRVEVVKKGSKSNEWRLRKVVGDEYGLSRGHQRGNLTQRGSGEDGTVSGAQRCGQSQKKGTESAQKEVQPRADV